MQKNRLKLETLSPEAVNQIEETAYRLLEKVGISLDHAAANDRGCLCPIGSPVEPGL
jgi:hypothetical protein